MRRIADIVRNELDAAGAQEFTLPFLQSDLPQETRHQQAAFRFKDHAGRDLWLGNAGEEAFADIARKEIRSYRDLPQTWYCIQAGFGDEERPGPGLLKVRESFACDSCSFDADSEGRVLSCKRHYDTCCRILFRCGLEYRIAKAAGGWEFLAQTSAGQTGAGEDLAVFCECGYTAKLEAASSNVRPQVDAPDEREPSEVHTPGQKTIADIAAFLKVPATHQIKSLVYIAEGRPYLFLLRGDHQLSAAKAISATGEAQARPALPEEIRSAFGADPGSLGPTGVTAIPVFADLALKGRRNLTCGANRNDYHLQGVTPDVHFQPFWADLRIVEQGDACLQCGRPLDVSPGVLVARVTERDSQAAGGSSVMILSAEGKQVPARVASSRIYLERIMALAVELHHDADGIIWPPTIAPFAVIITPVNYKNEVKMAADQLYEDLRTAGIDTLLDDRAERPGVKFKDADLTGIPYRIVIGPEKIKQGIVELFDRAARTTEVLDLTAIVRRMAG